MSKMAEEKAAGVGAAGGAGAADAAQRQQQLAAGEAAAARVRPVETLLRAAPLGLCVVAMTFMLRDHQSNEYGTVAYSDLGGFKYLVYANGICAAYSLVSVLYTAVPRPATVSRSWVVFLLDQVFTYLILAAGAAAAELLYLAYNGDKEVTWSEACGVFGSFCRQARTSVAPCSASSSSPSSPRTASSAPTRRPRRRRSATRVSRSLPTHAELKLPAGNLSTRKRGCKSVSIMCRRWK